MAVLGSRRGSLAAGGGGLRLPFFGRMSTSEFQDVDNCYNFGVPGHGQVFTDANFQGDCFEWQLQWGTVHFPGYMSSKVIRSWSGWPGQSLVLRDDFFAEARYLVHGNEWIANLAAYKDLVDYVDLGPLGG